VTRIVSLVLAVASGVCAAVLLAWGPTVHVQGHTRTCAGIIATAESDSPGRASGPCAAKQRQWALLAGFATLVCLSAGSVSRLSGREQEEPVRTDP
jgi:hypothetical protein